MASKAERKRRRKARAQGQVPQSGGQGASAPAAATRTQQSARPTPERMAHGKWAKPTGPDKHEQPLVDLASDMIGALYEDGKISASQEQAARLFQELRAAYLAELGTRGFGSCLADNQQGYDGSDGDPQVIAAYRTLEAKIGRVMTACLILECAKGPRERPVHLDVLKNALNCVQAA